MQMRYIVLILLCLSISVANAQLSGGGDLNPDLKAPKKAQEKWMDLRVGLSVHWGPSSLGGKEISWSRDHQIPKEEYDNYYKVFNPDKFDANEWAELMNRWGIKYMAPTAKHHDGFCLWFSDYSDYDMENAALKIDIMKELSKACKKHGIMFGSYYSNLDWYHPDWAPYNYGGPGKLFKKQDDSPNLERYFKFFENQCIELIKKYDLEFIQFDGEWDSTYTHEVGSRLYRRFHEVKPDILLNSRIDIGRRAAGHGNHLHLDGLKYAGDYQDRERLVNYGNNVISWLDHPWQAWVTIDKRQWSYNKTPKLMNADELIRDMVSVVGNNGNYMINLGPRPDGSFEAEQIALMDELGAWLKKHGEAIYKTRGGPFYPFEKGVSTRKGKKAWVMINDKNADKVILPELEQKIVSAKLFGTKQDVKVDQDEKSTVFHLKGVEYDGPVTVIELKFANNVEMVKSRIAPSEFELTGAKRLIDGVSYTVSSKLKNTHSEEKAKNLLNNEDVDDFAFHTDKEQNPHIIIDLGAEQTVDGMIIKNRIGRWSERSKGLTVWTSKDGKLWEKSWSAADVKKVWNVNFTTKSMGAEISGKKMKYIKVGLSGTNPEYFHLNKIEVYGR
ncbi:hypothetical protein EYV94_14255 [Puteibacter caeruleilacunae]|nr:hypothetical protein EYV94_14255 [Puteibacter caeruleilacunae]